MMPGRWSDVIRYAPVDGGGTSAAPGAAPIATSAGQPLSPEEARQRAEFSRRVAASFGHIVGVLMRSPSHKFNMLTDLETQVIPALASGQFRIAEAVSKETGFLAPAAFVTWALVGTEVDQRLVSDVEQPIRLRPDEWKSGDIAWLIEAVGDPRAVMSLIEHVKANELKDRPVKMRVKGKDGKVTVGRIELGAPPQDAPAA